MAPASTIVRYHQQGPALTFRVEGRGTMAHGLPVRKFAERAIEAGVRLVRFDLRACDYMDSTFLGTLLTIKKCLDRHGGQMVLLTPSPACGRILHQMGLDDVLPALDECTDPQAQWADLTTGADDAGSFRRNVTQAHEELAGLPGKSGELFKGVLRCMNDADKKAPPE